MAIVAIVGMVLVTMRTVRGGTVLIKSARPTDEQETLDVTVNRFLQRCPDGFELQSVEVFKDDAESPPGTDLDLETLDEGHCTSNITYCFETKYCGKPTCECKFNCEPWAFSDGSEVPSQLKEAGIAVAMD